MSKVLVAIPGSPGHNAQYLEAEVLTSFLRRRGHEVELLALSQFASAKMAAQRLSSTDASLIYFHLRGSREISALMEWQELGLIQFEGKVPPFCLAGGLVATHFAQEILDRAKFLQGVVRGELEIPIAWQLDRSTETSWREGPSLVTRDERGGFQVQPPSSDSPIQLSELPAAADDLLTTSSTGTRRVLFGRGCQSACRYCGFADYFKTLSAHQSSLWRPRPARQIVDELEDLKTRYGLDSFAFQAAVFFGYDARGSRAVEELCDELIRRGLGIRFHFVSHPNHLVRNAPLLPLLQRAGLEQVILGLDGGSEEALRRFDVEFTCQQGLEALELLSQHAISVMPSFVFYDPYTSPDDIRAQLHFLEQARPYFKHEKRPYSYFLDRHLLKRALEPKPFMPLIEDLKTDGLVQPNPEAPWGSPRIRFRNTEVAAFYRAHLHIDRELLQPLRPVLWSRHWTNARPELATLPLDVLRHLAEGLGLETSDEKAALVAARELARERLEPLDPILEDLCQDHQVRVLQALAPRLVAHGSSAIASTRHP